MPQCSSDPPPFAQARTWGSYSGALATSIQRFKFSGQLTQRAALEQLAVAAHQRFFAGRSFAAVVPVPAHPESLRRRGFDLAALLAAAVSGASGSPCRLQALRKLHPIPDLTTLGAAQRRRAVSHAYAPAAELQGEVLIVDDVLTATATARACSAACLAAGARNVWVLALARTPSQPREN